ncbi:acyl-CoA dehydrogenase family protein [Variovorax sp. Sphag1AA]|uniref:acyl-CoA dehydrogenase family protein n=1 Tax=Variovorax sp. Sphag1AA TaxID=2587027 RepID=UPI00160ABF40|nr:acyl-CoA dehydrogenase family protein [Variovorax sp. Sphag1AA]MBB3181605.1 acetyl-CoA C-acetyltransferase [Variovorax sp. Sphag1AA]
MTDSIANEFERALEQLCAPERLRAIEAGDAADADRLWRDVDALGFTDALVPAEHGGAGLALADACDLLLAAGRCGLPHPFGETMLARALLAAHGKRDVAGDGAIALAAATRDGEGLLCPDVPGARLASFVLVDAAGEWLLMPRADAEAVPGAMRPHASASLRWTSAREAAVRLDVGAATAVTLCNVARAAAMAGAMDRVLAMTVGYAGDRRQFGKVIAQFQAIQQELAVMAEQAAAAAMGARMGCTGDALCPDPLLAAAAKLRACEAAAIVAPLAHAVHGAIGITEELVLGVFTTRLHEWRGASATERACAEQLGRAVMRTGEGFIDFAAAALAPSA